MRHIHRVVGSVGIYLEKGYGIPTSQACAVQSHTNVRQLETAWQRTAAQCASEFRALLGDLTDTKERLLKLKEQFEAERRKLEADQIVWQRESFLRNQFLSDYKLQNIGSGRLATLASYGIETAHDVDRDRILEIPGFGEALAGTLMAWRSSVDAKFRFDPSKGIPVADLQALVQKYAQFESKFEAVLRNGPERLKGITEKSRQVLNVQTQRIERAKMVQAQAEADFSLVGIQR